MAVCFNDIVVYSKNEQEHQDHLPLIMLVLGREKLFGSLKKCAFFTNEVTFLGYIVTGDSVKADQSKIKAIRTWPIS